MKTGILIGYLAKRAEAHDAFRKLQRRGYRRAAWISKGADGEVRTYDPFHRRRILGAVLAFILFGALVGIGAHCVAQARPWWPEPVPGTLSSTPVQVAAGGLFGVLLSIGWIRRSRFGVDKKLLDDHAQWIVADETVLILQAPIETLQIPVVILQESSEIPPAIFILHPKYDTQVNATWSPAAPLSLAQLREHAPRVATGHMVDPKPLRDTQLLKRLERDSRWVHKACRDLSEAIRLEQGVPPTAEWLLDNEYILESNARDVQINLPRRYYQQLPALTCEFCRGLPRIYGLAKELVSHTDLRLDQENILAFIEAYQSVSPLSIGELWAVPQMLRIALMEGIQHLADRALRELRERATADFWANRLITANRRDPNQFFSILAELTEAHPTPSPYFASQLIDCLYDEGTALAPVQGWLSRALHTSLHDLGLRERNRQTKDQISVGNAFTSLRQLALLDWKVCFEQLSHVEQMMRLDPSGIYPRMDFDTRNRYRRAIEELNRGSALPEDQIAQCAVELAARAAGVGCGVSGVGESTFDTPHPTPDCDDRRAHVGAYLIGSARSELAHLIGCRESLRFRALHWAYRNHTAVYFLGLGFFTAGFISLTLLMGMAGEALWVQILTAVLLLIPASQLSLEVVNYLITRLFPPRALPKMDYSDSGIPDEFRTLVVVPTMLVDSSTIHAEVDNLEIRYLANKEANLLFGLFTDYTDAEELHCEADESLLKTAIECIETLNQRHGGERFFLFHRERKWSESEQKYIGWERKRGKLEELNGLIAGTRPPDAERLVYVGDPNQLSNVRFVITLDSDTQLPHDTARKMIETLAHPLNQPRFDSEGRVLAGTYTIIQPRVSPALPSASGSPFSRLFSDPVGIDPYTNAVSDVYQDLTGEGSYHGKGIYDVRAFNRVLSGTFPEAWLLSHDLIEGAHVRVGLASDINLYDELPQDHLSYVKRQHRWIRGDWQIADWIKPSVPRPGKGRGDNPLSWFGRWKVFDNLRRSLLPAANIILLIASWMISSPAGEIATIIVAAQLLFRSVAQHFTWATTPQGIGGVSLSKSAHDLVRVVAEAALLPCHAWVALDAIARVLYRRHISHRGLLEWTSAGAMHRKAQARVPLFVLSMSLASPFSMAASWSVLQWMPVNIGVAAPWLMLWFLSPMVGWLLNRRPQEKQPQFLLSAEDRRFLRNVSRRTWRYFSDFVNEESSWLPPDNFQVSHKNQLAMRTSPTNIGLWMVSLLSAHDFGYETVDDVANKLTGTMATIDKLERYEGHLLNWYDIQTLAPLKPHYVSTVDSGNLLGALWSLEHGLAGLTQTPLLDMKAFAGLQDTGEILRQVIVEEHASGFDALMLGELLGAWESPPERLVDAIRLLRRTESDAKTLYVALSRSTTSQRRSTYWAKQMHSQIVAWIRIVDRYLTWVEILDEATEEEITQLEPNCLTTFRKTLSQAPSLQDLARGKIPCFELIETILEQSPADAISLHKWIDRFLEAYDKSKWLAGEMLDSCERLIGAGRELSESINMRFLYDSKRRLFSIGYNVSEGRLDRAFYDLLASEARLGSYIAIARGDIPIEHWFAMGRPFGSVGRRRALLSWTGTMFEYLMPLLLQRSYANSLLDKAARDAVAIQINYGRKRRVPWGISESAFGDLDLHKTYQYHAFGVPELGFKRGLADKIVIAPYASMLAASIAPRETMRNLKRLAHLGLLGDYGYYEALDFSRQTRREGERGVVVRAYMSHHQGMSFLALTNFLQDNPLQRSFHSDPRVRAVEPLLYERIPHLPPLHHIATRERVSSVAAVGEVAPSVSQTETPHTITPRTQLLSNGGYALMITNAGGGYSRWRDFEITRWRSDRTRDSWGSFCYIHDADAGQLWCNTYHPTDGDVEAFSASFTIDRAVFRRIDHGIESETEIIIAPEDDVEIRRITLINRSPHTRRLNLTSYAELALAPHNADRQHPAFNKMFIQTETAPEHKALLAFRRPRSDNDPPIYVAQRFTLEGATNGDLRFETDRCRFIGRGRTLANPMGALQDLGNTEGFVLDPILSLRQEVQLTPGQRIQVSLVMAAGETREHVLDLMSKYGDPHAIEHAMDFAWATAQLELRLLRIQPDESRRFQQLASQLLYPSPLLRTSTADINENRKGQSGLWRYGISGDMPIVLVAISEARDLNLVRQMLQAHTYWRMHGLMADLVILNEESGGYEQPLREQLERLIQSNAASTGLDRPGGVYLRSADLVPPEDRLLLRAMASIVMVAARGTLPQQLGVATELFDLPGLLIRKRDHREPSAALPFMELPFFNSLGGFTPDGREYAIYLGPNIHTPAPWVNVIANPTFGTLVSETGAGFTWFGNSQRNRLTQWSNDPVLDPPSEALYIRDEESGIFWTPTASAIRDDTAYRARHGAGYTVFEHNSHGIEQELTVFVPVDDDGGEPIKLQRLLLRNDSDRTRTLSLTYYTEWTLGEARESSQMHVVTSWDDDVQALIARNHCNPDYPERVAFAAINAPVDSYTADRTVFIGRNRSMSNPVSMERIGLSRRTGAGLDPCAALQIMVSMAPGERTEITCMLGQAESLEEAHALVLAYQDDQVVEASLSQTKTWWDDRLQTIQVHTPELATDLMINRWLLYQTLSCRFWARSAFYQSGGAYGFRDQLQDAMALLYAYPQLAREHILFAASRQFMEGDVQHWWHQPSGAGMRSRISDDLLWLPYVVAQYIRITADTHILDEMVPFLDAPVLKDDQHEMFQSPSIASEQATLFDHCRRAVKRSQKFGVHGLPLMGTGDWNDGMNLVGAGGKGESVWLAWFMVDVLKGMAEMAKLLDDPVLAKTYTIDREAMIERIEDEAWDGEWYLRATFDDGTPLGSSANTEARIDSLPQSWACLTGAADPDRTSRALESAWNHLVREDEGLVLLFEPPFDQSQPSPGYIKGYPPGVRENGGQYTHAALWLAMAMARSGDGDRASKLMRILTPIEHAREPETVWRYGIEPYVAAADVYRLPGRIGAGGWSWYTGSAAWMYRVWVEEILGLKVRGDSMEINPVIPAWWDGFQMSYRHGEAIYEIVVDNPEHCEQGVSWMEMDGQRIDDGVILLEQGLIKHRILVCLGRPHETHLPQPIEVSPSAR